MFHDFKKLPMSCAGFFFGKGNTRNLLILQEKTDKTSWHVLAKQFKETNSAKIPATLPADVTPAGGAAQFPHNRTVMHNFFCPNLLNHAELRLQYEGNACINARRSAHRKANMSNDETPENDLQIGSSPTFGAIS